MRFVQSRTAAPDGAVPAAGGSPVHRQSLSSLRAPLGPTSPALATSGRAMRWLHCNRRELSHRHHGTVAVWLGNIMGRVGSGRCGRPSIDRTLTDTCLQISITDLAKLRRLQPGEQVHRPVIRKLRNGIDGSSENFGHFRRRVAQGDGACFCRRTPILGSAGLGFVSTLFPFLASTLVPVDFR